MPAPDMAHYYGLPKASEIKQFLKTNLSSKRYKHVKHVCKYAVLLAQRELPGQPGLVESSFFAALLHDCTKELNHTEQVKILQRHRAPVDFFMLPKPVVHSKTAPYFAREYFQTTDQLALDAIANHTTGRVGMHPVSQVVFAADYLGSLKKEQAGDEIKLTLRDLCLKKTIQTMSYLFDKGQPVHFDTINFYNSLVQN